MSSTTSLYPPTVTSSAQSLATPTGASRTSLSSKKKKPSDRIQATNCCSSFFYNIPRGSVMITLPGFAILAIGAILIATFPNHSDPNWLDGLQLISLIFLILGGVWTLAGLLFWVGAWCRYRPKAPPKAPFWPTPSAPSDVGLELVRVYRVDSNGIDNNPNQNANAQTTENGTIFTVS